MNRIDRLTAILVHLQGKPRVPIEDLEERFEVSRRTIFRDIRALLEAGVPIGGEAGVGYFIVEGYHLPPVVFNKEEAGAILLGSKLIEKNADIQTTRHFQEAMYKIKAVLRYRDKEFLDTLENSISVVGSPMVAHTGFPESHISELQEVLATGKVIRISYYSNYKDQLTEREVEPLGLVHYSSRWHLIGFCKLRQDFRDFRTDRIKDIKILEVTFDRKTHPDFMSFVQRMTGGTDVKEARIAFTRKVARWIQEQRYYYGFVEEKVKGEVVEMSFMTHHYHHLARWLMMFGTEAMVISPKELQEQLVAFAQELVEHCQDSLTDKSLLKS